MKSIAFIFSLLFPAFALAQPATQPTVEQLQAQYLIETGQLRQALGQAHAQIIELRKQLDEKATKDAPPAIPKK